MNPTTERLHRPVLGIGCKLGSVVLFAGMASCVKYLGPYIPVGQMIFVRGIISVVVLACVAMLTEGLHLLGTHNLKAHALRSLAGTLAMYCWFLSLTLIPLANMTAISFATPLFVTILAMLFLGERIHMFRWTALGVGFLGVAIMIGPQLTFSDGSQLGVGVAVAAAVFAAFAQMFLRSMSASEHAITITFYFSATSAACAAVTAVLGWPLPTAGQWLVIILAGLLGVFGQLLLSFSFRFAEASTIAPLDYTSLIMAVGFGYFLFDELPPLSIWVGSPLVVIAGLIIFWREYSLVRRPRRSSPG